MHCPKNKDSAWVRVLLVVCSLSLLPALSSASPIRLRTRVLGIDLPEVKLPEINLPEIKLPEIKKPDFSLPDINIPKPNIDLPDFKLPEIKVPDINIPKPNIDLPDFKLPEIKLPEIKLPDIKKPDFSLPDINIPKPNIDLPDFKLPEIKVPDINIPKPNIDLPDFKLPEIKVPDINIPKPNIDLPDFKLPEIKVPDINIPKPNIDLPDFKLPEIKVPDINIPKPNIDLPDFKLPEIKMPEIKKPDINLPDINIPKPNINLPDLKVPDINIPKPNINLPDLKVPDINIPKPNITLPDIKLPEVKLPDIKLPYPKLPELNLPTLNPVDFLKSIDPRRLVDWVSSKVRSATKNLGLDHIEDHIRADVMAVFERKLPGTQGEPMDPKDLPDLKYIAEFAAAAYCDPAHAVGKPVTCQKGYCPTITKNNVTAVQIFANKGLSDTTALLALDPATKRIILSYRGSKSIRNFFTNARLLPREVSHLCQGCFAHSGFVDATYEEFANIRKAIEELVKKYPGYKIVVTGHSLGGAIAAITAAELRIRGYVGKPADAKVDLYTYGAPRIGNEAFSKFISTPTAANQTSPPAPNLGRNFRVTFQDDPVPRLPPVALGYLHISPEYHIFRGNFPSNKKGATEDVKPEDIKVYGGNINIGGNTGAGKQVKEKEKKEKGKDGLERLVGPLDFNLWAHGRYFVKAGWVSGCSKMDGDKVEF